MLVLVSYLCRHGLLRMLKVRSYHIQVCRLGIAVTLHEQLFVVENLYGTEVVPRIGKLFYLALPVYGIEIFSTVPYTYIIYNSILLVVAPAEVVNIRVERLCKVALLATLKVVAAETQAVCFVTVALHREPCYVLAVG